MVKPPYIIGNNQNSSIIAYSPAYVKFEGINIKTKPPQNVTNSIIGMCPQFKRRKPPGMDGSLLYMSAADGNVPPP